MSNANAISDLERAEHLGYADGAGVKRVSVYNNGAQINAATEETLQATTNKLPTYDLYLTWNSDGTVNTKVWKLAGTGTVVATLTYGYSGGNLVTKILS